VRENVWYLSREVEVDAVLSRGFCFDFDLSREEEAWKKRDIEDGGMVWRERGRGRRERIYDRRGGMATLST